MSLQLLWFVVVCLLADQGGLEHPAAVLGAVVSVPPAVTHTVAPATRAMAVALVRTVTVRTVLSVESGIAMAFALDANASHGAVVGTHDVLAPRADPATVTHTLVVNACAMA